MLNFSLSELLVKLELREIIIEEFMDSSNILFFHGTKSFDIGLFWESVELDNSSSGLVSTKTGEIDVNQFQWVKRSVVVSGLGNWGWDNNSSSIDGLPNIFSVNSSSDFLDQHRGKSIVSQLLINTQKVDLSHLSLILLLKMHMNWDPSNESNQFSGFNKSNSQNPVFVVFWWSQCPSQKCWAIVKSEHIIFILDVILSQ